VPSQREGDHQGKSHWPAEWKNKPDLDSEERKMKNECDADPFSACNDALSGGQGDERYSVAFGHGQDQVRAANEAAWRTAA
jgi:hypothetical protein